MTFLKIEFTSNLDPKNMLEPFTDVLKSISKSRNLGIKLQFFRLNIGLE